MRHSRGDARFRLSGVLVVMVWTQLSTHISSGLSLSVTSMPGCALCCGTGLPLSEPVVGTTCRAPAQASSHPPQTAMVAPVDTSSAAGASHAEVHTGCASQHSVYNKYLLCNTARSTPLRCSLTAPQQSLCLVLSLNGLIRMEAVSQSTFPMVVHVQRVIRWSALQLSLRTKVRRQVAPQEQ